MKKEILRQLRSDYESIEIKPSRDLWDRIDHKIEEASDLPLKRSFQWWKYAAVVLLLISFGGIFYFNSKSAENNTALVKSGKQDSVSIIEKHDNKIISLQGEKVQHKNATASSESNIGEVKSEKPIIKPYQENFRSYDPILVKEENNIIKEDFANTLATEEKAHYQIVESPIIAEKKKTSYIKADDLLLGREFDKTREEHHNGQKKFGLLDMEKIKIKGPNSFKILGMTVYSDSSDTK